MDKTANSSIVKMNQKGYDQIATEFSNTRDHSWQDVDYLFKFVKPGDTVLDIGCGNGRLLRNSKHKIPNSNYLGVDFSGNLIEEARRLHPGFRFEVGDILEDKLTIINEGEKKFDAVFLISVLNHFPREVHDLVLRNVKKCLKPGGRLLMVNWNLWNVKNKKSVIRMKLHANNANMRMTRMGIKNILTTWKGGDKEAQLFYYAFTKGELKRLLKKNGFIVEENFYSKRGKRSSWLFGANIVTVCTVL